jgi:hypothetical protein
MISKAMKRWIKWFRRIREFKMSLRWNKERKMQQRRDINMR